MTFKYLYLCFFLVAGCATKAMMPSVAMRQKTIEKPANTILIDGLNDVDFLYLAQRKTDYRIVKGTSGTLDKLSNTTCVTIKTEALDISIYKKIAAIASLSLYPFQTSEKTSIQAANCESQKVFFFRDFTLTSYYGVLVPVLPTAMESKSSVKLSAIDYVLRSIDGL